MQIIALSPPLVKQALKSYSLPQNGTAAMFDFYALYSLWNAIGSGKVNNSEEEILPNYVTITNRRREEVINHAMADCTRQLGKAVLEGLKFSIYSELEHAFTNEMVWWNGQYPELDIKMKSYKSKPVSQLDKTFSIEEAYLIYKYGAWLEGYGGEQWAKVIDAYHHLEKNLNSNLQSLIVAIDRIYDMQHNTGFVLDKTWLNVDQNNLDVRHHMRSPEGFLHSKAISPYVRNLIASALNYPVVAKEPGEIKVLAIPKRDEWWINDKKSYSWEHIVKVYPDLAKATKFYYRRRLGFYGTTPPQSFPRQDVIPVYEDNPRGLLAIQNGDKILYNGISYDASLFNVSRLG